MFISLISPHLISTPHFIQLALFGRSHGKLSRTLWSDPVCSGCDQSQRTEQSPSADIEDVDTGTLSPGSSRIFIWGERTMHTCGLEVSQPLAILAIADKRHLQYADHGTLFVPRTTTTLGMRSVAVVGPHIWNSLPAAIRTATLSPLAFVRHLKTHLFDWD